MNRKVHTLNKDIDGKSQIKIIEATMAENKTRWLCPF